MFDLTSLMFCSRSCLCDRRWNAAKALATYLDRPDTRHVYAGKNVLELGAGGGLPSIVTAKNGAEKVHQE